MYRIKHDVGERDLIDQATKSPLDNYLLEPTMDVSMKDITALTMLQKVAT